MAICVVKVIQFYNFSPSNMKHGMIIITVQEGSHVCMLFLELVKISSIISSLIVQQKMKCNSRCHSILIKCRYT